MAYRKINLNGTNQKIIAPHYPSVGSKKRSKKHKALLGIGGNIGDVLRRFEHLFWYLKNDKRVRVLQTSPILKNPPFGYQEQMDFFNAVIVIETNLTPCELLNFILRVEKKFGRRRSFKNSPRTLDIDMIKYDKIRLNRPKLTLPHPFWQQRESVLLPISWMKEG